MASIALCMIVKDEAHIIQRCLENLRPLLDYVLIVDTGSSDGTQQVIQDFLDQWQLPGGVIEEPWQNFAYNRSFALAELRQQTLIDYALMLDADEVLVYQADFDPVSFKASLDCDIYDIQTRYGNAVYWRPQLFSNRLPFAFKGVLHEYLDTSGQYRRGQAIGFYNHPLQDSRRSFNPKKFQDDAAVLEQALRTESDPFLISRYTFYLAQSYRDCGNRPRALECYLRRAEQGYWAQEVFVSLLNAGRLREALGQSSADIIQTYLAAYEVAPDRLEALHDAMRHCRNSGKYQQAYLLGKQAVANRQLPDGLFVEPWIYDYGLLDEFSLAAYWSGHYAEAWEALLTLWQAPGLPAGYRARLLENARFIVEKLGKPPLLDWLV